MLAGSERRFRPIKGAMYLRNNKLSKQRPPNTYFPVPGGTNHAAESGTRWTARPTAIDGDYRAADGAGGLTGSRADLRAEREEGPGNVTCRSAIVRFI